MSLANSIGSRTRKPTCQVILTRFADASVWDITRYIPDVQGAITGSDQFGQPIAGWSVKYRGLPFIPQIKDIVEIYLGYDYYNLIQFTGFVTDPQFQSFPKGGTMQLRDILWIGDFPVTQTKGTILYDSNGNPIAVQDAGIVLNGPAGTPNDVPANDAILRLLRDWAGIPEFRIKVPPLEISPGVPWVLGHLSPVTWTNVSPLQACQQICEVLGYWLYADAGGYVRAIKISGTPSGTAVRVFSEGDPMLSNGDYIVPGPTAQGNVDQAYNRCIVTGATTLLVPGATDPITGLPGVSAAFPVTFTAQVDSALLPPGKFRDLAYNNPLIEYTTIVQSGDASCEAVALRSIKEHSRKPFSLNVPIKADPRLVVGQTVGMIAPRINLGTQVNFFIYGISYSFGGGQFDQTLTLDGGTGQTGYSGNPPPVASFTYTMMTETLNGITYAEIFCKAVTVSASGIVAAFAWACAAGSPATGTTPMWETSVPLSVGSADITLTVTDVAGISSVPYTQHIVFSGAAKPSARKISFAAGNNWHVTPDGGATWRIESGQAAIAVPPIGAGGDVHSTDDDTVAGALATGGTVGQTVRSTKDLLVTSSVAEATLSSAINFLWQNEITPTRVWACVGPSVYFSSDSGLTFVLAGTPPVPSGEPDSTTRWVVESATLSNQIDVLAGRYLFQSFDGGHTFGAPSVTGPAGSIAKCYTSGFAKHWVGFTGCASGSSPLRSLEGDTITFGSASPEVLDIRAVTLMQDTPDLYAFDAQGRIWHLAAGGGIPAHVADMP